MPKGVYNHKPHKGMFKKGVSPYNKGKKLSKEHRDKIAEANLGRTYTKEVKQRMSKGQKLRFEKSPPWNKGLGTKHYICLSCKVNFSTKTKDRKFCSQICYVKENSGDKNYRYIKDREKIVGRHNRSFHDSEMKQWRIKVYSRDSYKCKIYNEECLGRIEAHHILRWKDYPDLRYILSNGITLCHFHHPKTRTKEDMLQEYFTQLISK